MPYDNILNPLSGSAVGEDTGARNRALKTGPGVLDPDHLLEADQGAVELEFRPVD